MKIKDKPWILTLLLLAAIAGVWVFKPSTPPQTGLRVGYICNFMAHEWYQKVCASAEQAAKDAGISLTIANANGDSALQKRLAENLFTKGVDVLAITPVDAKAVVPIVEEAKRLGIPVFTESNVVAGAKTYVGINNFQAGVKAGIWVGNYINEKMKEQARILICGFPAFEDCRNRVSGFKEGLKQACSKKFEIIEVDGSGEKEKALRVCSDALIAHPDVNVIFGINDDSALGGMQAYINAGLPQDRLFVICFGLEGRAGKQAMLGNTPVRAGLAMFPEIVGRSIVEVAQRVARSEKLPHHFETPTLILTPETLLHYYRQEDGEFKINPKAISKFK